MHNASSVMYISHTSDVSLVATAHTLRTQLLSWDLVHPRDWPSDAICFLGISVVRLRPDAGSPVVLLRLYVGEYAGTATGIHRVA